MVSKLDLVDVMPRDLDAGLAALNPHAARSRGADLFAEGATPHVIAPDAHDHAGHDHLAEQGIVTRTIRLSAPLDWPRYAAWVQWMQQALGPRLLRMKGVVRMQDGDVRALHAVMQLFSAPQPVVSMPPEFGDGIIVVIAQDVSPAILEEASRRLASPG